MSPIQGSMAPNHNGDFPNQPLVSVGIPTYNRPDGLRRTLSCISKQTYKHIEIIISDNCSTCVDTQDVIRNFAERDSRIQAYRQVVNIGAGANFRFVLAKASGYYFMWAADDDEWDEEFIEYCLQHIQNSGTIMSGYRFLNRYTGNFFHDTSIELPARTPQFRALTLFLNNPFNHAIYGLHRRSAIIFILNEPNFDWMDSYIVMRLILEQGVIINTSRYLYTAGMDTPVYEHKPATKGGFTRFTYVLPFIKVSSLFLYTNKLNVFQKFTLMSRWFWHLFNGFAGLEKSSLPFLAFCASCVTRAASLPGRLAHLVLRRHS